MNCLSPKWEKLSSIGGVAKWQCAGLQSWLSWFDSNTRLQLFAEVFPDLRLSFA